MGKMGALGIAARHAVEWIGWLVLATLALGKVTVSFHGDIWKTFVSGGIWIGIPLAAGIYGYCTARRKA